MNKPELVSSIVEKTGLKKKKGPHAREPPGLLRRFCGVHFSISLQ